MSGSEVPTEVVEAYKIMSYLVRAKDRPVALAGGSDNLEPGPEVPFVPEPSEQTVRTAAAKMLKFDEHRGMTDDEIQELKHTSMHLFRRGLPQVKSSAEFWRLACQKNNLAQPPSNRTLLARGRPNRADDHTPKSQPANPNNSIATAPS